MKTTITLTILLIGLIGFSQEDTVTKSKFRFGAKTGINISSAKVDIDKSDWGTNETYSAKSIIGYNFGGLVEYSVNDKVKVQSELLFSRQGYDLNFKGGNHDETYVYKFNYLAIPLIFKYNVIDNLFVEAGLNVAFLLGGKVKNISIYDAEGTQFDLNSTTTEDLPKGISSTDIGLNVGASYEYKSFVVGARYTLGLTDLDSFDYDDGLRSDKSRNFAITVGYFLN